jgi:hypothetical protein
VKLYWGSSVGRSYTPDHVTSLIQFFTNSPHPMYWKPIHGDALIERSRGRAATGFLHSDADVMLMVDTDIVFDWRDLIQIAEQAVTHDIVVGAYTTRSPRRNFITSVVEKGRPIEFWADPTPVPIVWGATGFMAVHRRVFEKMAKREDMPLCHEDEYWEHYPFFTPFVVDAPNNKKVLLSEDFAFCERARQEGFTVYLNPKVRLGHFGDYLFRLEDTTLVRPDNETFPIELTRLNDESPANFRVRRPTEKELKRLSRRMKAASA